MDLSPVSPWRWVKQCWCTLEAPHADGCTADFSNVVPKVVPKAPVFPTFKASQKSGNTFFCFFSELCSVSRGISHFDILRNQCQHDFQQWTLSHLSTLATHLVDRFHTGVLRDGVAACGFLAVICLLDDPGTVYCWGFFEFDPIHSHPNHQHPFRNSPPLGPMTASSIQTSSAIIKKISSSSSTAPEFSPIEITQSAKDFTCGAAWRTSRPTWRCAPSARPGAATATTTDQPRHAETATRQTARLAATAVRFGTHRAHLRKWEIWRKVGKIHKA